MRAVVKTGSGPGLVEVASRPVPDCAPDEVLVRVARCAVSSADLRVWDDRMPYYPPIVLGQQFSGVVERTGADVVGIEPGARVMCEVHGRTCGRCRFCLTGRRQFCHDKRVLGIGLDGAMAEYVAVPARLAHRVPDSLGDDAAALVEPAAVCLNGIVSRAGVEPGDTVVIVGCDFNALVAIQILRALGAGSILVAGTPLDEEVRVPMACELGATESVGLQRVDLTDFVMDFTGGLGADLVVDFLGQSGAMDETLSLIRTLGRYLVIGYADSEDLELPWRRMYQRAVSLHFHYSSSYTACEQVIRFAADGRLSLDPLVTDVLPLAEWESAFRFARAVEAVKVLIDPSA